MTTKPAPGGTAPSGPVGRITGTSVTELRFRIGPDGTAHLGEVLIADATASDPPTTPSGGHPPFYLRVTDLEYGADARDGDWEERTAGALMATGAEDLVLYDRESRLFKSAV